MESKAQQGKRKGSRRKTSLGKDNSSSTESRGSEVNVRLWEKKTTRRV